MEKGEMPTGLGMALLQNPEAMQRFASLSEEKKQAIINGTHSIHSRDEMRRYVESIVGEKRDI